MGARVTEDRRYGGMSGGCTLSHNGNRAYARRDAPSSLRGGWRLDHWPSSDGLRVGKFQPVSQSDLVGYNRPASEHRPASDHGATREYCDHGGCGGGCPNLPDDGPS